MQIYLNCKALNCIPSNNEFKTQNTTKLRWLASDINFKLLHTGCPVDHGWSLKVDTKSYVSVILILTEPLANDVSSYQINVCIT